MFRKTFEFIDKHIKIFSAIALAVLVVYIAFFQALPSLQEQREAESGKEGFVEVAEEEEEVAREKPKREPFNTSNEGITPGKSLTPDIYKFGNPRSTVKNPDGSYFYLFGPKRSPHPTEVVVKDERIVYLKKLRTPDDPKFISYYLDKYGDPDLIKYSDIYMHKVYIYLDGGVAFVVNYDEGDLNGLIFQIIYFIPMSEEEFLSTWGKNLLDDPPKYEWH